MNEALNWHSIPSFTLNKIWYFFRKDICEWELVQHESCIYEDNEDLQTALCGWPGGRNGNTDESTTQTIHSNNPCFGVHNCVRICWSAHGIACGCMLNCVRALLEEIQYIFVRSDDRPGKCLIPHDNIWRLLVCAICLAPLKAWTAISWSRASTRKFGFTIGSEEVSLLLMDTLPRLNGIKSPIDMEA